MTLDPVTDRLREAVEQFELLDAPMRLELLLEYARGLPALPEALRAEREAGLGRVPECQAPVFLYVSLGPEGRLRLHLDAPEEAPTVRGFLGLLQQTLDGATPEEVAAVPDDLLYRLGIGPALGMTRQQGLAAVLYRLKHAVAEQAGR